MTDQESYVPRSPDLSGYNVEEPPALAESSFSLTTPAPGGDQQAVATSSGDRHTSTVPEQKTFHSNPRPRHGRPDAEMEDDWAPESKGPSGRKSKKVKVEVDYGTKPAPGVEEGIEVKTKFPVARIKRIMQADEDVGKVAQVTPTAVSKALELFMISLVLKAAKQAQAKHAKKVTAAHLKQAVLSDEQFDFLAETVAKVPDAPAPKKEEDSEGAIAEGKKRRAAPRRKKAEAEDA